MSKITTPRALAEHLGWNMSDVTDYRYQQSKNRHAIYVICDDYMTACPVGKSPKPFEFHTWQKLDSWITKPYGWEIYKAIPDE